MLIHIILTILKIIGILLLTVLGILLFLILSVLFMPVCYYGKADKEGEKYRALVRVSWLIRMISVSGEISSDREDPELQIRIFGITTDQYENFFRRFKKDRTVTEEEKFPEKEEIREEKEKETVKELPDKKPVQITEEKPEEDRKKIPEKSGKKSEDPEKTPREKGKWKKKLENLKKKKEEICSKVSFLKEILSSDAFKNVKKLAIKELKNLWKMIRPRKLRGNLSFGFEDPALTGKVLGGAAMFYSFYGKNISICPYFDRKILEGSIELSGRIYGVFFVRLIWIYFTNKDIKAFKKIIKTKED